jgi:hypothetical protein
MTNKSEEVSRHCDIQVVTRTGSKTGRGHLGLRLHFEVPNVEYVA